jgi:hypothetical protein
LQNYYETGGMRSIEIMTDLFFAISIYETNKLIQNIITNSIKLKPHLLLKVLAESFFLVNIVRSW